MSPVKIALRSTWGQAKFENEKKKKEYQYMSGMNFVFNTFSIPNR